ncbi:hypothetical protein P7C71_g97, partial [Lecanoromycetidae sp. Uapishka_2]
MLFIILLLSLLGLRAIAAPIDNSVGMSSLLLSLSIIASLLNHIQHSPVKYGCRREATTVPDNHAKLETTFAVNATHGHMQFWKRKADTVAPVVTPVFGKREEESAETTTPQYWKRDEEAASKVQPAVQQF